ncbi:hypothetical protein BO70DRAFT_378534 [Aspergillus heteromorphus CBS 117.55]|uniref:Uncharacterized protein n=1 Tax=Aspergillus heteromorphus CBS 117.55 TaxID=1448321 RepID=A0A317WNQ6_9EURO|nr:uncharacterized protein BO70DRAFT_378534 [Aspergillus heteromorphus CBS 117.55]PWY86912.1 hypothetical protein BO70DRAFT_378534 [Aspergillus heteromorphus CBS 117.55]
MSSSISEMAQEDPQWACIPELASQLACLASGGSDSEDTVPGPGPYYNCLSHNPRLYTFSSHLVEALLQNKPIDNAFNIHQILSMLTDNKRIVHVLENTSLRCLAYILLTSNVEDGPQNGLYLLLDEPQSIRDSGCMVHQATVPQAGEQSRLLLAKLIQSLYHIFATEEHVVRLRRLAGKILIDIISESELNGALLVEHQEVKLLPSILLNEADAILKVFATTILHTLHKSGVSIDLPWPPDSTEQRTTFFECLGVYGNSVLQLFHDFNNEVNPLSHTKEQSAEALGCHTNSRNCFLVQSVDIDAKAPLIDGTVLVIPTKDGLAFVRNQTETSRAQLEYTEVRLGNIYQHAQQLLDSSNKRRYRLTCTLSRSNPISLNDRRRSFSGHVLGIASNNDLSDLQKAIEIICQNPRGSPRPSTNIRRSSSLLVQLDTGEEISKKSSGLQTSPQGNTGPRKGKPEGTSDEPSENVSPDIQLNSKEDLHDDTLEYTQLQKGQRNLYEKCFLSSSPLQDQREGPACRLASPVLDTLVSRSLKDLQTGGRTLRHAAKVPRPNEPVILKPKYRPKDSAHDQPPKEAPTPLQKKPSRKTARATKTTTRRQTRMTSGKRRGKLSNTQESLIFSTRHPKQKVYSTNSKPVVDWYEDLRPSDEADRSKHQEAEVTSVSSPMPGDGCVFEKGQISLGKRRTAPAKSILSKKGGHPRTKRKGGKKNTKETMKPSTISRREGAENSNLETNEIDIKTKATAIDSNENDSSLVLACSEFPFIQDEKGSVEEQSIDESTAEIQENDYLCFVEKFHTDHRRFRGRGHAVGSKLLAAFKQDNLSSPDSKEDALEHTQRESTQEAPNEPVRSDGLLIRGPKSTHMHPSDRTLVEDLRSAEHVEEEYIMVDNQSMSGSSHEIVMHGFQDDFNTENLSVKLRKRARIWDLDDGEQATGLQTCSPIASRVGTQRPFGNGLFQSGNAGTRADRDIGILGSALKTNRSPLIMSEESSLPSSGHLQYNVNREYVESGRLLAREPSPHIYKEIGHPTKYTKLTPRSIIVDPNGSPRLLFGERKESVVREIMPVREHIQTSVEEGKSSVTEGDIIDKDRDTVAYLEQITNAESGHNLAASCRKGATLCSKDMSVSPSVPSNFKHSEDEACMSYISSKEPLSLKERLKVCTDVHGSGKTSQGPRNAVQLALNGRFAPGGESKSQNTHRPTAQASPFRKSPQGLSKSKPVTLSAGADGRPQQTSWQLSLQATSDHIIREIESERRMINDVLEIYRQDCNRVLDQLFEAQEERIRLCEQQLRSIQQHHTDVCQELVHRLERNEQQVQQRMHLGNAAPGEAKRGTF